MNLEEVKEACFKGKIKWSVHSASRIQERGIRRKDVIHCIMEGEMIEDYPDDFPHPSCLVFGLTMERDVIHTVVGYDGDYAYIITAYYPDIIKFEEDLKTRRVK